MELKELNRTITERNFSNLYFFYGEEDYLKEFYINRIIQSVVDDNFSCFNLFHYQQLPDKTELRNTLEQPPVMAEYKVVYLNQVDLMKAPADFREALTEQMKNLAPFTILIIRETALDKRSAIWTISQKQGVCVECKYPNPADMRAFINREFTKRQKKIPASLVDKIITDSEPNMYAIINLIETICAYLQDIDTVTEQVLDQFMQKSMQAVIFDLSEFLVTGQKEKAYRLLNQLKLTPSKTPAQMIFTLLARHISGMYLAKIGQDERIPNAEIRPLLGKNVPDFVINKYLRQGKNISAKKLEQLLIFCAETDCKLKSGQVTDPYLGIYTLFLQFWSL
ncbi:MAG: DNA polymerase III subunit delta [Ruminococcaceae bacterium]|nr:DNA polymerase III subunit delta [Oscillospiraceae bacterium]